ncbi:MAG: hypothetical protein QM770_18285 [Tepidisphaeraceae bacterium]
MSCNDQAHLDSLVFRSGLDDAQPAMILLDQAHGWLVAAESVVMQAVSSARRASIYQALPALFCLYHGVELFLKGVACEVTRKPPTQTHDLERLNREFGIAVSKHPRGDSLAIKANIHRFIDHDKKQSRRSGPKQSSPQGSDFRFVLNSDGHPSWAGIMVRWRDVLDLSREYRRDFSRIRRVLYNVKGFGAFWEEGTFARFYPDDELWFFCICGIFSSGEVGETGRHGLVDARGRRWVAFEGEAINEDNCFELRMGDMPRPYAHVRSSFNALPNVLATL